LVATAALTTVKTLLDEGVLENCERVGEYFRERLRRLQSKYAFIREVRGKGLLIGLDLTCDGISIVKACMERGFLINCTQQHILRFIPPLIIKEEDIDSLVACLDSVFEGLSTGSEG
jgi:acetylornithine/N-succinyldiaminopimelate aminotransferase